MAYKPPLYTEKEFLYNELTLKGRTINQLAQEFKVSRSCIYSYVKKFEVVAEEFVTTLDDLMKLRKERRTNIAASEEVFQVEAKIRHIKEEVEIEVPKDPWDPDSVMIMKKVTRTSEVDF